MGPSHLPSLEGNRGSLDPLPSKGEAECTETNLFPPPTPEKKEHTWRHKCKFKKHRIASTAHLNICLGDSCQIL